MASEEGANPEPLLPLHLGFPVWRLAELTFFWATDSVLAHLTSLPCPLCPPSPVLWAPGSPSSRRRELVSWATTGGEWGREGEGWYSCWGGLRGSICHPGCPVNYSAAVRTDSLPSLLSSPETFLLFPLRQAPLCLCLGGLNPCSVPLSSGCSSLGTFESLSSYLFFLFLL